MDRKRVEYKLEYFGDRHDTVLQVMYFDSVNDAYSFITNNKLYTFNLIKEELIASRHDPKFNIKEN